MKRTVAGREKINTIERRRSFLALLSGNGVDLLRLLLLLGIPHKATWEQGEKNARAPPGRPDVSYPAIFKWGVTFSV